MFLRQYHPRARHQSKVELSSFAQVLGGKAPIPPTGS